MSREPEFLIAAVRRFLTPKAVLPDFSAVNWTALIRLAEAHSVNAMIHGGLRGAEVPKPAANELHSSYEKSVAWSLAQCGELSRVVQLLEDQGISVVALKGPLLSRYLYGDLGSRTSGDIDLLVRRDRVVEIRRILLARGYRVKTVAHWDSGSACLRSRENEMSFESPSGVSIDVHWRLIPPFFASPCDALNPWSDLHAVSLAGRSVQTLAPESLFLFLCAHGSKHTFERLGWICDVAQFLIVTPDLDWPKVVAFAQQASALRQVVLSVRVAVDLLGAPPPPGLPNDPRVEHLAAVIRRRLESGSIPPASAVDSTRFGLQLLESPSQRVRFLAGLYITPSEAEYKAVNLPPWLHFLYYPYRPVRLLWRNIATLRGTTRQL